MTLSRCRRVPETGREGGRYIESHRLGNQTELASTATIQRIIYTFRFYLEREFWDCITIQHLFVFDEEYSYQTTTYETICPSTK